MSYINVIATLISGAIIIKSIIKFLAQTFQLFNDKFQILDFDFSSVKEESSFIFILSATHDFDFPSWFFLYF